LVKTTIDTESNPRGPSEWNKWYHTNGGIKVQAYLGAALADHDNRDGAHYDTDNNRSHNADDNSRIDSAAAAAAAASASVWVFVAAE